jgi:hypothetical protein
MKEISEAEYNELKACHLMLGQISIYVEDFCKEEDTTLMGVIKLLAEYHSLKSDLLYEAFDKLKEKNDHDI